MKKQLTLILLCLWSIQFTQAQNFIHKFGKVSYEDFNFQKYDKDTSAEAVVIYDIGESRFEDGDDGFDIIFTRKVKIKILTKAGLKWADFSIPLYKKDQKIEEVSELKGNTYNFENGRIKISPLDPKNAYDEKYNENWWDKKFAMPDVREGSVVEVSYQIKSPYLFNFRSWEFQKRIPVIYSEYITKMIPFYEYTYICQGTSKFDSYKSYQDNGISRNYGSLEYNDMVYDFVMKDLPAFKDESFITSIDDYIIKIDFQLAAVHFPTGGTTDVMTTWPKLCKELTSNTDFGKYMNTSRKKCKDILDTMHLASKSAIEKAQYIDQTMKANFNWNGTRTKFASKSVKDFMTSKTGNCADINLFMAGMLEAAGIEVYPVILSTRDHGQVKIDYPFQHFFNYVIVCAKIDSSLILLDATEPYSSFNEIPSRCINNKGLIIQKAKTEWVNLKTPRVSSITYYFDDALKPETDSLSQNCKLITKGYEAIAYRKKYANSYKDLKSSLLGKSASTNDTLKAIDLNQYEKPMEIDFNNSIPLEIIDNKLVVSPFGNFPFSENPLKQPTRNYPVDFIYKKDYLFQATIKIPEGYKLLQVPKNTIINNKLVKIVYFTNTQSKDSIVVVGNYEFKRDSYDSSVYSELKNYFNTIVDKFNEKLILEKI